jgi:transposase-like protein
MNNSRNGSNRRERRHFASQQKAAIIKAHLVDRVPISDLCEQHQIQPTQFYLWQKQLFEHADAAFESKTGRGGRKGKTVGQSTEQRKIEQLQAKLATKNEVIAELMEENVKVKKECGEL